jgi:hypothetical protein
VLPKSLIATDRRIVEFGFRCPMALKAGGRIFHGNRSRVLIFSQAACS